MGMIVFAVLVVGLVSIILFGSKNKRSIRNISSAGSYSTPMISDDILTDTNDNSHHSSHSHNSDNNHHHTSDHHSHSYDSHSSSSDGGFSSSGGSDNF